MREGAAVARLDAPEDFPGLLEPLPGGVELRRAARGPVDVVVLFVTSRARLARRFPAAKGAIGTDGGIWGAWPKKTAAGAPGWSKKRRPPSTAPGPRSGSWSGWPTGRPGRAASGPGGGAGPSPAA